MTAKENTIFDYIHWRGDLSFNIEDINEIDLSIFALFSYIDWTSTLKNGVNIPFIKAANKYLDKVEDDETIRQVISFDKKLKDCLKAMTERTRFSKVYILDFEEHLDFQESEQFSAISFKIPELEKIVVAFRGTDDSWVGWKEDFLLASEKEIPSQNSAKEYLKKVLHNNTEDIIVTGHSKGGNLAVYASAMQEDVERIERVYSFDGIGFEFDVMDKAAFEKIENKVINLMPRDAFIGVILETVGENIGVDSLDLSIFEQHNLFSWKVDVKTFIRSDMSELSKNIKNIFRSWLKDMDLEERAELTDAVFYLLGAEEGKWVPSDINDFVKQWRAWQEKKPNLSEGSQKMIDEMLKAMTGIIHESFLDRVKKKLPWVKKEK